MRVHVPKSFRVIMTGPEGDYELACGALADDPWEGWINTEIAGVRMRWPVEQVVDDGSGPEVGGLTIGTKDVWGDVFWYSLCPAGDPPHIDYFGNQVLWRRDIGKFAPEVK